MTQNNLKLALTILTLCAMIGSAMAQDNEGVSNVNFPPNDNEAKNWTVTKNDNGNIDLTYNGNRRVLDVNTVRFIDLGIIINDKRIKWATTNVGAINPWDFGDYYAWGEIETKEAYNESYNNYTFYDNGSFTKYNATDKISSLQSDDDIATVTFGNNCAIPTPAEWSALINDCKWIWYNSYKGTSINGYAVFKKKSTDTYSIDSDPHIFLPASGSYKNGNLNSKGTEGWFWSSSISNLNNSEFIASELHITSGKQELQESNRYYGLSVRPVMRKNAYINLDKREASVYPEKTITLKATTDPANQSVVWKSADETIATVDNNGVVTGQKPGTTTITATYKGQDAICIVTVLVPPSGITLSDPKYPNPYVWGKYDEAYRTITATITPSNANDKNVTWTSSHPEIISVEGTGGNNNVAKIKIVAPNESDGVVAVTITAMSSYKNSIKKEYTIYLDNYVDLGTGEDENNGEYWKTTKEANTYSYTNAENKFDKKNLPSKYDYEHLRNRCIINGDIIKNRNNSGAYIKCEKLDYWTNTQSSSSKNYSFSHKSNDNSIGETDKTKALYVRCVRRFGNMKVTKITIAGNFSSPYIWGRESSSSKISLDVEPSYATKKDVTWSSSDTKIATVDKDGTVKIVGPNESDGNATITITATANDGSGVKGTYQFKVANYVDLYTTSYWYTTNAKNSKTFTYSEAESEYPDYSDKTNNIISDKHLPDFEKDIKPLFDTEVFTWTYNGNTATVKHKNSGVYINFPFIQCSTKTETWYAYWSWNKYSLGFGVYYLGLEFQHNETIWNPPNDGHLHKDDAFPVRLVKER